MAVIVIPLAADLPCVLFALRRESMVFRRAHRPMRRLQPAPCYAAVAHAEAHPILLLETGVGRGAAEGALDWLLAVVPRPRWLIVAGFAGALDPALRVGDVLIADQVMDAAGHRWQTCMPAQPWPGVQTGLLFTAERLIGAPAQKHQLGRLHGSRMVDMETAYLAERCVRAAIPFFCLRAISDTADSVLSPELVALLAGGRASARRLLGAACRRPALLVELRRLGRDTRIAAGHLARTIDLLAAALWAEGWQAWPAGGFTDARATMADTVAVEGREGDDRDGWPLPQK